MNKKYLPCPFCGWKTVETRDVIMEIGQNVYRARCKNCQSCSSNFDTEKECIDSWNRRTPIIQQPLSGSPDGSPKCHGKKIAQTIVMGE